MSLTLTEAAKLSQDMLQRGVIQTFAESSAFLEMLPQMDIQGNAYAYNLEGELPGVAFRGVNESYTESTGIINPKTERLYIAGGDLDIDTYIVKTQSDKNDQRAIQTAMKVKALSLALTKQYFNGDSAVDPKGFDGLKTRITGDQVISAGTNGGVLTIAMLDELVDAIEGEASALFCSKAMRREIKKLLQNHSGYSESALDAFGRPIITYGGVPIRVIEKDNVGAEILGFNETQGTANDTGSIYAVRFGAGDAVSGLQSGIMDVRDLGELQDKPAFRTRVEWFAGMAVFNARTAARLKGIKKSA
ncbi:major capsid protein [Paenibacillus vini]|uniref:Major capsid protein n=1 Tax=Paenibacillus vini TaxID=1476024 RepID=A0ABQ4MH30_9BACL|nr:phage major capsid protein [Paenibacillus vini]GIP55254.1 hypothetical protein J42TS3_42890 [Paenibacillus vini]